MVLLGDPMYSGGRDYTVPHITSGTLILAMTAFSGVVSGCYRCPHARGERMRIGGHHVAAV